MRICERLCCTAHKFYMNRESKAKKIFACAFIIIIIVHTKLQQIWFYFIFSLFFSVHNLLFIFYCVYRTPCCVHIYWVCIRDFICRYVRARTRWWDIVRLLPRSQINWGVFIPPLFSFSFSDKSRLSRGWVAQVLHTCIQYTYVCVCHF